MALPLRITSFNVLNAGYENEDYYERETYPWLHWENGRKERLCRYIRQLGSDIYSLQEVSSLMAFEIGVALGKEYDSVWKPRTIDGSKTTDGCATFYRKNLLLESSFTWRYPSDKHIFLATLFVSGEHKFWIVNTHVNWETREADLLTLQRQLNEHPDFTPDPKLVMGDFNAERHEEWYKALASHNLVDAMTEEEQKTALYSYNSGKLSKWIDFMLLHNLARDAVSRFGIGDRLAAPDFSDVALPSARVPSDHFPITATVNF